MPFVPVARIVGTHGLKGYLKLALLTGHPDRFVAGGRLRLDDEWVTIRSTALHQDRLMIQLDSVRDRTAAEALRGKVLEAPEAPPIMDEDEFLVRDLIGCSVVTSTGEPLGQVDDVLP